MKGGGYKPANSPICPCTATTVENFSSTLPSLKVLIKFSQQMDLRHEI